MQLAVIAAIVIAIASVTFAIQNSVPATVVFLLWRFDGSLAMILLLALAAGALIIALVSTPSALRSHWQIKRLRKEIDGLKADNAELRARAAETQRRQAGTAASDGGSQSMIAQTGASKRGTESEA